MHFSQNQSLYFLNAPRILYKTVFPRRYQINCFAILLILRTLPFLSSKKFLIEAKFREKSIELLEFYSQNVVLILVFIASSSNSEADWTLRMAYTYATH